MIIFAQFSEHKEQMRQRWLHTILLFLLMSLGGLQQANATSHAQEDERQQAEQWLSFCQSKHKHQAVLTDSSQLLRICSSRPERVVPVQTAEFKDNSVRRLSYTFKNVFYRHYPGVQTNATSRIMLVPSPDYYVYRLRHIVV